MCGSSRARRKRKFIFQTGIHPQGHLRQTMRTQKVYTLDRKEFKIQEAALPFLRLPCKWGGRKKYFDNLKEQLRKTFVTKRLYLVNCF